MNTHTHTRVRAHTHTHTQGILIFTRTCAGLGGGRVWAHMCIISSRCPALLERMTYRTKQTKVSDGDAANTQNHDAADTQNHNSADTQNHDNHTTNQHVLPGDDKGFGNGAPKHAHNDNRNGVVDPRAHGQNDDDVHMRDNSLNGGRDGENRHPHRDHDHGSEMDAAPRNRDQHNGGGERDAVMGYWEVVLEEKRSTIVHLLWWIYTGVYGCACVCMYVCV
jgi:hypothetical protein